MNRLESFESSSSESRDLAEAALSAKHPPEIDRLVCRWTASEPPRWLVHSHVSAEAIAAVKTLLEVIQRLRSLSSSLDPERALTPEVLVPYVSEEAYEVLEALQTQPVEVEPPGSPYLTMEDWMAILLWAIARHAYSTLQLIEGVPMDVWHPHRGWQSGIARLVVLLVATSSTGSWQFDLATRSLLGQLLDPSTQLQSDLLVLPSSENTPPTVQAILEHLQTTLAGVRGWQTGIPMQWLIPGEDWQTGQWQLQFGLEFTPQPLTSWAAPVPPSFATSDATKAPTAASSPITAQTFIRLADPEQQQAYQKKVDEQRLLSVIGQCGDRLSGLDPDDQVLEIVRAACTIAIQPADPASACLLQPELLMDELVPKLLWRLTGTAYSVMQWIGSLSVSVLQPHAQWQQGHLRLLPLLELTTEEGSTRLDLATGHWLTELSSALSPEAIYHLKSAIANSTAPPTPGISSLQALSNSLVEMVHQTAPELSLLMAGMAIEWLAADQDWQSGTLCLRVGWEFVPEISGSFADPTQTAVFIPYVTHS
jgi:hypothetical protein